MTEVCKLTPLSINKETTNSNTKSRVIYDREILLQHECINPPEDIAIKIEEFFRQLLSIHPNKKYNQNKSINKQINSKQFSSNNKKHLNVNKENLNNNTPLKNKMSKVKSGVAPPLSLKKSEEIKTSLLKVSVHNKPAKTEEPSLKIDEIDNIIKDQESDVDQSLLSVLNKGSQPASAERRIEQREKQLQYGYNTEGYKNYIKLVPKEKRKKGMPVTPNKYQDCSKRSWDGQVRAWRRALHQFDNIDNNLIIKSLDF